MVLLQHRSTGGLKLKQALVQLSHGARRQKFQRFQAAGCKAGNTGCAGAVTSGLACIKYLAFKAALAVLGQRCNLAELLVKRGLACNTLQFVHFGVQLASIHQQGGHHQGS